MALIQTLFALFLGLLVGARVQTPPARRAAPARPELLIQTGHVRPFEAIAVGSDGRLIATADGGYGDGTIKLWQGVDGLQVRTLAAHAGGVLAAAISPNNRLVASGHRDDTIRIWDIKSGRLLKTFYVPTIGAGKLFFSANSRYLLSLPEMERPGAGRGKEHDDRPDPCVSVPSKPGFCESRSISVWDVELGRFMYDATPAFDFRVDDGDRWYTAMSPDGRFLLTGVGTKPIDVRVLATGRKLPSPQGAIGPFVVSPDGGRVAARTADGRVGIWNIVTRQLLSTTATTPEVPAAFAANGRELVTIFDKWRQEGAITTWDAATGLEKTRLPLARELECANCSVTVSADGAWAVRGGSGQPRLALWNLRHPEREPQLWSDLTSPIAFSPKIDRLFAGYLDRVWSIDLDTATESCSPLRKLSPVNAVMIGGTPPWPATLQRDVIAWDAETGVPSRVDPAQLSASIALSIFNRGQSTSHAELGASWVPGIASGPQPAPRFTWQQPDCAVPASLAAVGGVGRWGFMPYGELNAGLPFPVAFAPNGDLVENDDDALRLTNAFWASNSAPIAIRNLSGPPGGSSEVTAVAYNTDGSELAAAVSSGDASVINVLDAATRRRKAVLSGHADHIRSLAYYPRKSILASAGSDNALRLWDTATEEQIRMWTLPDAPTSIAIRPDGSYIGVAMGNEVIEYDFGGSLWCRYQGHSADINAFAYSPDRSLLFSGSDDGTSRVWSTKTCTELATLVTVPGTDDWLVVAPDGLFDGSPGGWTQLLWRFNKNTFDVAPVETFYREFYRPGLLAKILAGERPKATTDVSQIDRRQPEVSITLPAIPPGGVVASRRGSITVSVREAPADQTHRRGSGVRDLRLFRNGSQIKVWHGEIALDAKGLATRTLDDVAFVAGENHFSAYAFNDADIKSRDADAVVTGAEALGRKGTAWILSMGIEHYLPQNFQLHAAIADARDFANAFANTQRTLGRYEPHVVLLEDRAAIKSNILLALDILSGRRTAPTDADSPLRELRRVQPEDAVVIFFAGHGTADGARFYLMPRDVEYIGTRDTLTAVELHKMIAGAISDQELSGAVEGIDARDFVLVIDACRSGQVVAADDPRQGPINSQGFAQLAYEKGMYILTASQSYQDANEAPEENGKPRHGLLTQALLDGLAGGPSTGFGEQRSTFTATPIREWLDDAAATVPRLYRKAQAVMGRPVVQELVQRPRVFYRRFPERIPFVVVPGIRK